MKPRIDYSHPEALLLTQLRSSPYAVIARCFRATLLDPHPPPLPLATLSVPRLAFKLASWMVNRIFFTFLLFQKLVWRRQSSLSFSQLLRLPSSFNTVHCSRRFALFSPFSSMSFFIPSLNMCDSASVLF